jgi:hypothetical protein
MGPLSDKAVSRPNPAVALRRAKGGKTAVPCRPPGYRRREQPEWHRDTQFVRGNGAENAGAPNGDFAGQEFEKVADRLTAAAHCQSQAG